jgi:diaminohydroxyphosphoribosylaminopyrimidine deaminase/5-amino-6-(5-phosphoribosylamino)uracil reductase
MTANPDDARWMEAALAFGRRGLGLTAPNPSVAALIVRDGGVVGRGVTQPGGRPHAERRAIAEAGEAARGATLYVTLEPCSHHGVTPPCAEAVIEAGLARVVSAIEDADPRVAGRGHALLRQAGVETLVGVGEATARRDHRGHFSRVNLGRPLVTLKIARTADGFAAGDTYDRRLMITSEAANARVQVLRSMHDAIMVGVGTALIDDPLLTLRLPGATGKPLRIVIDSRLRLPPDSRLAATASAYPTLIVTTPSAPADRRASLLARGLEVIDVAATAEGHVDLAAALAALGKRGLTRVFSEGGPQLGSQLVRLGLADEVTLITAPKPLGRPGLPALDPDALARLDDAAQYEIAEISRFEPDELRRWDRRD